MAAAVLKSVLLLGVIVAASGFSLGPQDLVFHLFRNENRDQSIPVWPTLQSLSQIPAFDITRRLIVAIPGHGEGVGQFGAHVVTAHLDAENVNIFVVDWSAGASMYSEGLAQAPQCGLIIANFINIFVREFGVPASQFRIIGHGLGGHISGIAARQVQATVPHIIALDPSLHGWPHHPARLTPNDATVVEVIYTTAGILAFDEPLGDLNFLANGGTHQPTCGNLATCSHDFAFIFYGESVRNSATGPAFVGTRCDNFQQALANACSGQRDATFGGTGLKASGNGIYTFATNPVPPFARG